MPPRFQEGPFPLSCRPHGEDVFVALIHKRMPPLLLKPWHEADVPGCCFQRDRRSVLVQLKLDGLHDRFPAMELGILSAPGLVSNHRDAWCHCLLRTCQELASYLAIPKIQSAHYLWMSLMQVKQRRAFAAANNYFLGRSSGNARHN